MKKLTIAGAAFLGFWSAGHSQDIPADLLACRFVTADAVRLACFDKATGRATAKPEPLATEATALDNPATPPVRRNWLVNKTTSAITDDTNHFVQTRSTNSVQCRPFSQASTPLTLTARCMENSTAIMVMGDCQFASGFSGYGEVTWRTDDDKARTRNFEASTDSLALGLWSGKQSIPVIKELLGKKRLVVRVTPFGLSPVEATFDITGLEEAIKPLRQECGW